MLYENFLLSYHISATTDDFYDVAQKLLNDEQKNLQIKPILDSWFYRKGYPLITVTRNYENKMVNIRQDAICGFNSNKEYNYTENLWHVPINYATTEKLDFDKTTTEYWLTNVSMAIDLNIDFNHWLILNKQQTGRINKSLLRTPNKKFFLHFSLI